MKLYLFIVQALLVASHTNGQSEGNNWVMPDSLMISFNSGFSMTSPISTSDPNLSHYRDKFSVYSDSGGSVILYTNGKEFFLSDGSKLSDELTPSYNGGDDLSVSMNVIIKKNFNELYYIASINPVQFNKLYYSTYNIETEAFSSIDNELYSSSDGFITLNSVAIRHGNGRDWWLISSTGDTLYFEDEAGYSMHFLKTLFSSSSTSMPEIWESETTHGNHYSQQGVIASSNMGNLIVKVEGELLHFYTFDRCTGEMNDYLSIYDLDSVTGYLAEFSPNDSKLYVTTRSSYIGIGHPYSPAAIIQYCLDCGVDIASTKDTIYRFENDKYDFYGMKLGPDGKIYLTAARLDLGEDDPLPDYQTHFWVINHPDSLGAACDLDTASISSGGRNLVSSFPNIPNYQLGAWRGSPCDTIDTSNAVIEPLPATFQIYPNPVSHQLYISNPLPSSCHAIVYNAQGQVVQRFVVLPGSNLLEVNNWVRGCYMVTIMDEQKLLYIETLIKME